MTDRYFHFELGPVQAFVAQARRTRDFWAGSFLLSWLSAVAIAAVHKHHGTVIFPKPRQEFLDWLTGNGTGEAPRQGSIPNRFVARVPEDFDPALIGKDVKAAWKALADTVWSYDLKGVYDEARYPEVRAIWERQIEGFWQLAWCLTNDPEAMDRLDRHKHWRAFMPADEPGVKCMVMDGFQELSGTTSPHAESLAAFWSTLRNHPGSGRASDLRETEQLCAVAFVKRRFARWFQTLETTLPSGLTLRGWRVNTGVPSVAYMAAAHWLADALTHAPSKALWNFHDAAYELTQEYGEWDTDITCIAEAQPHRKWRALNGEVFFKASLENHRLWEERAEQAQNVSKELKALREAANLPEPTPFYAVLLMDGDSLGDNIRQPATRQALTDALDTFTSEVETIVYRKNGFLVYAGGDDVLAVLPLEDALPCAAELRRCYLACFEGTGIATTLSGAIEYTHVRTPLGKILADAHELLDGVAKERTGRDAIACRVWKPGGQVLQWAQPWSQALAGDDVEVQALGKQIIGDEAPADAGFANRFFYRIRERFDLLNGPPGAEGVLDPEEQIDFMTMEYLRSEPRSKVPQAKARERVQRLLAQCRPHVRVTSDDGTAINADDALYADGALLARFLAQKGV